LTDRLSAAERRNVAVLAACQVMLLSVNATVVTLNGLAGYQLAINKAQATLPVTFWVIGAAIATFPASMLMKRIGRRGGFTLGAAIGIGGSALCTWALARQDFWMLCFGTLIFGLYNGFGQYFRFAAADAARPSLRAKAISLVLAGGLVGGLIGPGLSTLTIELHPVKYLASYLSATVYLLIMMAVVQALRLPATSAEEAHGPTRPLAEIARQPEYIVAVVTAAISYGVMNLLMTATPLAMGFCGHPYGSAANVIAWHIIGMFAPSLITGDLIKRFGLLPIMLSGVALLVVCVFIALAGITVAHFWWSMFLMGVGWNFMYVGATALITTTYRPAEKAKAQGANEIAIFLTMVSSSYTSGFLLDRNGWETINWASLPFVILAGAAIVWLMLRRQAAAAAA